MNNAHIIKEQSGKHGDTTKEPSSSESSSTDDDTVGSVTSSEREVRQF